MNQERKSFLETCRKLRWVLENGQNVSSLPFTIDVYFQNVCRDYGKPEWFKEQNRINKVVQINRFRTEGGDA